MKKEQQTIPAYEAPIVEVIEVEVEQGFSMSGIGSDTDGNHNFGERN